MVRSKDSAEEKERTRKVRQANRPADEMAEGKAQGKQTVEEKNRGQRDEGAGVSDPGRCLIEAG